MTYPAVMNVRKGSQTGHLPSLPWKMDNWTSEKAYCIDEIWHDFFIRDLQIMG